MYSLTLQNAAGDSIITSGDIIGRVNFAVPAESDGYSATYISSFINSEADGPFSSGSNPAGLVFGVSSADPYPATGVLKISSDGHFLPLMSGVYDIGASNLKFRNCYIENGNFDNLNISGVSVSFSGHMHMASDIIDFSEAVDDRVNNLLIEGTGVQLSYNDSGNALIINNLHTEINELSLEPQGFVNRTDSIISFNDSTRTFTIQPTGSSYDVYIEGIKVTKTGTETVVIGSGTALNYLHFDTATQQLQNKTTAFNFDTDVPIAFIHWNGGINQSTFFGEERHGIRMDSSTHKWIHNTFGMQYIDGLSIGNYVLLGNGSSNSHAQISVSDGTLYQEDIIINIMDGDNGVEFTQQLYPTGYFPVYYHSGVTGQWVRDSSTPYPVKYNATRALYNSYSGGTWSVINVTNNRYFAMWLVATNDINDPILSILGQREDSSLGSAENNNNWTDIDLTNIPTNEIRPLYRLIFVTNDTFTNTPKSSLQSILDLRRSILTTTYGIPQNDHGNLFGLGDDDHAQYVHINEARTISANHTLTNGLTINNGLLSATSGNFSQILNVNSSGVFASGLNISNQTANTIASFDSNKNVASLSTSTYPSLTELSYVKGVTSAIQTQIDSKAATSTTITAGSGLVGGGSLAANRTIDIGQGDGITVSADSIAVNSTVVRTTGTQTISGTKTFTGDTVFTTGVVISSSGTNVPLTITHDGTGNCFVVNDVTGDTSPFVIDGSGNVGIGTTSPTAKAHIAGTVSYGQLRLSPTSNNGESSMAFFQDAAATDTNDAWILGQGCWGLTGNFVIGNENNGTGGNIRLAIQKGGNVGIGTSNPQQKFVVSNNGTEGIEIIPAVNPNESRIQSYDRSLLVYNKFSIACRTFELFNGVGNITTIAGDITGNVGIGIASPTQKLHLNSGILRISGGGANSNGEINLDSGTQYDGWQVRKDSSTLWAVKSVTAGNDMAVFVDNTNTRGIYIKTGGNVGIGTTSPASILHIAGTSSTFDGLLISTTASGAGAYSQIRFGTYYPTWTVAAPASIRCIDDGNFSSHITFRTKTAGSASSADVERLRITSAGNLEIRTNAGNVASAFVYNENGGELVHYDETQTAATLLDQSSNQTRLLELINGSNLVLGLGGSNTTGSIVFTRAGYAEAMRIDSAGSAWIKSTRAWNDAIPTLNIGNDGDGRLQTRHVWGKNAGSTAAEHLFLQHGNTSQHVQIGATGGGNNLYVVGDIYANGYFGGAMLLYGASGLRRGVHQITDWNQATLPDVAFLSSENAATNAPTTDFTYGVQTSFHRSGPNYRTQFVTSLYGNNAYWFRQLRDSAGWSTWVQMLHSGNFNSYALPLSGGTVTGPVEISTGATNGNYNEGLRLAIANNGWTGITFGSTGLAGAPTNGWFAARNPSNQFIISPADSNNTTGLTLNSGGNALWRNNILLHAGNYNSYAPTLTGTGASGTWGISITGTARGLDSSHYIARTGSSGNANTDFSNTPAGTTRISGDDANLTNGAGGAWWFYQHMRHSNASSTWGVQVAWGWEDNANILRTRNVGAGTFGSWVTYLNSANYNSYAPTLTGGNASGTWGISITGYAANGLDAWVHFDGLNPAGNGVAVNIQSNFNVLSVVRNSAGNFTVNFINALSSSNYAVFTSATVGSTGFSTQTTSSVVVFSQTVAGTPTNPSRMSVGAVIL